MTDNDQTAVFGAGASREDRETRLTDGADELASRARGSILGTRASCSG